MAAKSKKTSGFLQRYSSDSGKARKAVWDSVDSELVYRLVVAVSRAGCAVLFGASRDGGAWSLRFYEDGHGESDYCGDEDELSDWLLNHVEWWEGYAEEQESPQNTQKGR